MEVFGVKIDWVLDWTRVVNLIMVLLPFFLAVGAGFKFLLDRSERRENARTEKAEQREEERDERRRKEIEDMNNARSIFHGEILKEAARMRELYENELTRGLSLRTALAEAAQREIVLQNTIIELTRKVDQLQNEMEDLRKELKERG